jgi:ABC-type maltose transport system permease subunit
MVWGCYCAREILIANPIDWLFAACLEYLFQEDINSLYHFERILGNIPGAYVTSHFHKLYTASPFASKLNFNRYCACEILIANPIDWLFAACLEYLFFSIDSSEARKQYDEYCHKVWKIEIFFCGLNAY